MGEVYLGQDPTLDRQVAVKVLYPHLAANEEFTARFVREARSIAGIQHPSIVSVYFAQAQGEECFLAMEYVDGAHLGAIIRNCGILPIEVSLTIAREIARALVAAHEQEIIHRDIKPENVMLSRSGSIKVMDFGLARPLDEGPPLTDTGIYLGTPEYSSPEHCTGDKIDFRSDLYSLGIVIYQLFTGQVPHSADSPYTLFRKIVEDEPVPLRDLNPSLPVDLNDLVISLLEKEPEQRLQSSRILLQKLDTLLNTYTTTPEEVNSYLVETVEKTCQAITEGSIPTFSSPPPSRQSSALLGSRKFRWKSMRLAVVGFFVLLTLALGVFLQNDAFSPSAPRPSREKWISTLSPPLVLAVLDLTNYSEEPDDNWLSIGLSELLTTSLEQSKLFSMIARDRVQEAKSSFRNATPPLRKLAKSLAADVLILGHVRSSGPNPDDHVVVNLQLKSPDGWILASASGKGRRTEVFELTDNLVSQLIDQVHRELTPSPSPQPPLASSSRNDLAQRMDPPSTPPDQPNSPSAPQKSPPKPQRRRFLMLPVDMGEMETRVHQWLRTNFTVTCRSRAQHHLSLYANDPEKNPEHLHSARRILLQGLQLDPKNLVLQKELKRVEKRLWK
jgi:serine/threonine protein kinase